MCRSRATACRSEKILDDARGSASDTGSPGPQVSRSTALLRSPGRCGSAAPWAPILEGELGERAARAVDEIARALADFPCEDLSLGGGRAGEVIFRHYRGESAEARLRLDELLALAQALPPRPPSLYGEGLGIAWVAAHLGLGDMEDLPEAGLFALPSDFDLINGVVGAGVHALERLPLPEARECLERCVDALEESADGAAWRTTPRDGSWQRAKAPGDYFDLGVAHGLAGVVAFLGEAVAADVRRSAAARLLVRSVEWLLVRRLPVAGPCFPAIVGVGVAPEPSRLAWCYGDLGIAAALLQASRRMGETRREREAVEIALRAAAASPVEGKVCDASLCHGAAGIAHVLNRMFHASGDERLLRAAREWFDRTLRFRRADAGIAGFSAWGPDGRHDEPGLLIGVSGIGLALLAAATDVEPAWDRVLLLSGM
ncbi:MAG: lanthionine synthetase C family protein [Planctomycetes bacterium]|nr:lanthionine synthetase C family protein [Planctomycetota bacterium]